MPRYLKSFFFVIMLCVGEVAILYRLKSVPVEHEWIRMLFIEMFWVLIFVVWIIGLLRILHEEIVVPHFRKHENEKSDS